MISEIYLKTTCDVNTAFDTYTGMYNGIKMEEAALLDKLEIHISFDDTAIDELIHQAVEKDEDAGSLAFRLAKKLEYGLKLVRDRSGIETFTITDEAVTDMEKYINDLVKRYYRQDYDLPYGEVLDGD